MYLHNAFIFILLFLVNFYLSSSDTLIDDSYDTLWKAYQVKYEKRYLPQEESVRRFVWEQNAKKIAKHNLEADLGLKSYKLALNKFSDKTKKELDDIRKCFNSNDLHKITTKDKLFNSKRLDSTLPKHVDWRKKGFVTEVKDQGDCGSCWAFSSTGALEGQVKAKYGHLVSLSEQNLIDCSKKQGNDGCDGGYMESAFQYVIDNHGIDTEEAYRYTGLDGHCKFKRSGVGANCTHYYKIKRGSELDLQSAVANIGPISVAIYVTDNFFHYKSGIFNDTLCWPFILDHAVLVVGYGSQNGTDYWIVKNSWGTDWGMDGYILMSRNAKNQCGIASDAVYPSV